MLTPEQLAAMKAAAEEGARLWAAATAPPWTVFAELNLRAPDPRPGRYTKQPTTQCPLTNSGLELEQKAINIRFIAHARNTEYPAMLCEAVAEIERLHSTATKLAAEFRVAGDEWAAVRLETEIFYNTQERNG